MPRRLVIGLAAAVCAAAGTLPAPAAEAAPRVKRVCHAQANLFDTPGGLVVGIVVRGDRVRVLRRTKGRTWVRVASPLQTRGWLRARALC